MNGGLISTASAYGMCLPGMRFTDIYLPHVPITQEQPISGFVSENTSNVVRNKRSKNTVWEIANPLASTTESDRIFEDFRIKTFTLSPRLFNSRTK
jgi:hypothetical protein